MRNRIILGVLAVLLIAAGVIGGRAFDATGTVRADDNASISVKVTEDLGINDGSLGIKDGDGCQFTDSLSALVNDIHQVIVKDEQGSIIAVHTLTDAKFQVDKTSKAMSCLVETNIGVPKATFYSLYLDDTLLITLTKDDLGAGKQYWISIPKM